MMLDKLIRKALLGVLFTVAFGSVSSLVANENDQGFEIIKVGPNDGQKRPFSWYYHDKFDYYTPTRPHAGSCHWLYKDGNYQYKCY